MKKRVNEKIVKQFTPYTEKDREENFIPFTDKDKRTPEERNPAYAAAKKAAAERMKNKSNEAVTLTSDQAMQVIRESVIRILRDIYGGRIKQ